MWNRKPVRAKRLTVGFRGEDVFCQSVRMVDVSQIATRLRGIQPPSLIGDIMGFNTLGSLQLLRYRRSRLDLIHWVLIGYSDRGDLYEI